MKRNSRSFLLMGTLALGLLGAVFSAFPSAQTPARRGTENGEWRYLGGDAGSTRYSPLDQVTPANFETLKEAWRFSPLDVVGPMTARATPSYVGGKLLSVAGPRRHVVSIDPTSGKLLWNFVEPETYPIEVLDARGLRQGRRVPRDQRPRRGLHLHAGLLPLRARRGDRQAARELGTARSGSRRSRAPASWISSRI